MGLIMELMRGWAVIFIFILTGCSSSPKVLSDHDPQADFGSYNTFAWAQPNPLVTVKSQGLVSPMVERHMMNSFESAMLNKGIRRTDNRDEADLLVVFSVGSRDQVRIDNYGTAGYGGYTGGRRGYRWGGYQQVSVRQKTKGQMSVDLYDNKTHEPVWHGTTSKTITSSDKERPEAVIDLLMRAIIDAYPYGPPPG